MSKLHKPAIERVLKPVEPEGHKMIFEAMIDEAEELGRDINNVCMMFIEDGDEFEVGEWVPELWFVVRKVLPEEGDS